MIFKLFGEITTSSKTTPNSMPYFAIITFNSYSKKLTNTVLAVVKSSDETAFKNCKQSIGKFFTVGIEGNNCKIRHLIRRGFRRSCNFSKKLENHFKAFDLTFFYINNGFI